MTHADRDYLHGGIKAKYRIFKSEVIGTLYGNLVREDGTTSPMWKEKVYKDTDHNAFYYVLRLDGEHDINAQVAALAYSYMVEPLNQEMAHDLRFVLANECINGMGQLYEQLYAIATSAQFLEMMARHTGKDQVRSHSPLSPSNLTRTCPHCRACSTEREWRIATAAKSNVALSCIRTFTELTDEKPDGVGWYYCPECGQSVRDGDDRLDCSAATVQAYIEKIAVLSAARAQRDAGVLFLLSDLIEDGFEATIERGKDCWFVAVLAPEGVRSLLTRDGILLLQEDWPKDFTESLAFSTLDDAFAAYDAWRTSLPKAEQTPEGGAA